jgi:hypothetical protein
MNDWIKQYFPFIFPFYFAALYTLVMYWIALVGGWRLLAKRFRLQGTFASEKWTGQSAAMRWLTRYNNVLTIGADSAGLYVAPFVLFRAWHPALFVPWSEITDVRETQFLFIKFVKMRLGRVEEIPFRIRATLAARIRAAAGPEWPATYTRALTSPPPPIG